MDAATQCLNVYHESKARIDAGTGTVQDEVVVELWTLVKDQQTDLAKKEHKISLLESTEYINIEKMEQTTEALALLNKVRYTH